MDSFLANNHLQRLPIEIWTSVFEYAAAEVEAQRASIEDEFYQRRGTLLSQIPPEDGVLHEELDSPTCFPYAAAATCQFFRSLLADIPSAWRRIRVFLDTEDPSQALKEYLSRLQRRNLSPTDILVSRRNWRSLAISVVRLEDDRDPGPSPELDVYLDPGEKRKVENVLDVLRPHLLQATSLTIQTMSGDALPSILWFSNMSFPSLHTLSLDSLLRGRPSRSLSDNTDKIPVYSVDLPIARNLTLTGPNFVALLRSPPWYDWFHTVFKDDTPRFIKLRISHYRDVDGIETPDHPEFTLENFFSNFSAGCQSVGELVDISCSSYDIDSDSLHFPTLEILRMERVSTAVIQSYLRCVPFYLHDYYPSEFTHVFVDCDIGPSDRWPPLEDLRRRYTIFGDSLEISGISEPNTLKLYLDLAGDHISGLWVTDCPGFDDSVVRHLVDKTKPGRRPIPGLRALYLRNCPKVSLPALREAVGELNDAFVARGVDDEHIGVSDWEISSDFASIMADFYDGILNDESLDCPKTPGGGPDYDSSVWESRAPEDDYSDEDFEDTPDDWSSSDTSDGDTDSVLVGLRPQIRHIQFSGASPQVTEEDIAWFEHRGVILEVVPHKRG